MDKIIKDFKYFIDLCSENLWAFGDGLEDNFKTYVDTPANNLDQYLNTDYQGTPLWFYFLCFEHNFFDYFKDRISLKNDWDYTLLFNVDYIESSKHFVSLADSICHQHLNPFCPFDVLFQLLKKEESFSHNSQFNFSFPQHTMDKFNHSIYSGFLKNVKINFNLSSFSHILDNHYQVGIDTLHSLMKNQNLKNTFLSQLSNSHNDHFFNVKINLFFNYPEHCHDSFIDKIDSQQLSLLVTEIISQKKFVNKDMLFKLMSKEHLILAIHNGYFSLSELSSFISDKNIHYHLLNHKLTPHNNLNVKKKKI